MKKETYFSEFLSVSGSFQSRAKLKIFSKKFDNKFNNLLKCISFKKLSVSGSFSVQGKTENFFHTKKN